MVYGTKNYGAVASAYGPLTRLMPKAKDSSTNRQPDQQKKAKQKELESSILEYTKRMDKIKQARIAISKSREQGRLSHLPTQSKKHKVVLPGLNELENNAFSLTNKFISHAQWRSATNVAHEVNETLTPEKAIKSNIFSKEIQKLSESSPNSFNRYWRVLNDGGRVKHVPVLKTPDGIVYSTVARPATINKPETGDKTNKQAEDTDVKVVKVDDATTQLTTQTYRKYHPGILPKPGTKGPYKSRVTLHVSLPQMEQELNGEFEHDTESDSCSIDLPHDGSNSQSSSRVNTPKHTVMVHGGETAKATQDNKEKFEAAIHAGDKKIDESGESQNGSDENNAHAKRSVVETCTNDDMKSITHTAKVAEGKDSEQQHKAGKEDPTTPPVVTEIKDVKTEKGNAPKKLEHTHKEPNHYPCDDCPVCEMEKETNATPKPQKSILKKDEKPLPDIPPVGDSSSGLNSKNKRKGSLRQIKLPGGTIKLGKVTYHRSYKINVRPIPPHIKGIVGGMKPEMTIHDSFEDAVKRTDVLKEAERTLQFEKNRKENQERRKKFAADPKGKLWQSLCRHGRFIKECYTCRAVEEIRQRLKNTYSNSEQQYQWNLLSKHERHLTQGIGAKKPRQPSARDNTPFRLSAIADTSDIRDIAEDTDKPDGRPGGRVIVDKEGGRMNPQGLLPTQTESGLSDKDASIAQSDEDTASKRVRFAEEQIYDPMRGSYRKGAGERGQVLLPAIKN